MENKKAALKIRKSERGQAIVLMVLLITGLLAMAGLAVDGGRLYYSQRTAQNAADNAALAGAWAACTGGNVNSTAFASALANEYDNNGSTNSVTVNRPPSSGPNVGDSEYIEVIINSSEEAGFSQLVFSGSLESTVRAVGRCNPGVPGPVGGGNAIISLKPDDDRTFHVTGNATITVNGGSIFVNSNDDTAIHVHGGAVVIASEGTEVVGGYELEGGAVFSPLPVTGAPPMPDPLAALAAPPNPGGTCNNYSLGGSGVDVIDPGLYCKIKVNASASLTMNPGTYYIDDDDFEVSGSADLVANGVMIYLTEGKFTITGTGDIDISAPTSGTYEGMMLFMDQSNDSNIKVTGTGSVTTTGTIYGAASEIEMKGGGSNVVINSQVITYKVKVAGNGDLELNYDPNSSYKSGAGNSLIELAE